MNEITKVESRPNTYKDQVAPHLRKFLKANRIVANSELLDLTDSLDLLDARKKALLAREAEAVPAPEVWGQLRDEFKVYNTARWEAQKAQTQAATEKASRKFAKALKNIENLVTSTYYIDVGIPKAISEIDKQFNELLKTELTRRKLVADNVTQDQLKRVLGQIVEIIVNNVDDDRELQTILAQLNQVEI